MAGNALEEYAINVETFGTGARKVVALHCSLGRAAGWAQIATPMGDQITLFAPDWPSHGKSGPWTETGPMREAAVAITGNVVGDGPVDLIGHSFGAIIALDYATRHPEKVKTLTVIEPIFMAIAGEDDRPLLDAYLKDMEPHFSALAEGRNEDAAKEFIRMWGGGADWDKMPEPVKAGMIRQIPIVDACKPGDENSPEERRVLDALCKLTMPVKIIYGGSTLHIVSLAMKGLAARLPNAEMVEVPKAGHMLPLTHPQVVIEELQKLWKAYP